MDSSRITLYAGQTYFPPTLKTLFLSRVGQAQKTHPNIPGTATGGRLRLPDPAVGSHRPGRRM